MEWKAWNGVEGLYALCSLTAVGLKTLIFIHWIFSFCEGKVISLRRRTAWSLVQAVKKGVGCILQHWQSSFQLGGCARSQVFSMFHNWGNEHLSKSIILLITFFCWNPYSFTHWDSSKCKSWSVNKGNKGYFFLRHFNRGNKTSLRYMRKIFEIMLQRKDCSKNFLLMKGVY